MTTRFALFQLVVPLALAGCATAGPDDQAYAPSGDGRSCFYLSQVSGYNDAPDVGTGGDRIVVSVGARDKYLFETFGFCPDLNWSETIGFDQNGPGQICNGTDVDLIVPTSIGPQRCPVRMIRKLSKAEFEAL